MPPPAQGTQSTPASDSRPPQQTQSRPPPSQSRPPQRPAPTSNPSISRPASSSPASSVPTPSQTPSSLPVTSSTPSPTHPATHSTTSSRGAHSPHSSSSASGATPSAVVAASSSPVPTSTIAAASAAGAVVLLLIVAWQVYRCRGRKRSALPPPRPFSTWVNDRSARSHTVYDNTDKDPYTISSLYGGPSSAAYSLSSSVKASPTWEAPAFLTLPEHSREPTSSDTSSSIPRGSTPSTAVSALPLIDSSVDSDPALDRPAPFTNALSHHASRGSLSSSRDSPDPFSTEGSFESTPADYTAGLAPVTRPPSVTSTTRSARRSQTARPVSYAPSVASRHSIYNVSASTIRGAPHQPHNRVQIVLPAPLAPELFVPVAPFMRDHTRSASDRSRMSARMSMGAISAATYGQAWHDDSSSREGSILGRDDDIISLKSHRLSSATFPAQQSEALPPVPPLPASIARSASPSKGSLYRSDSPALTRPSTSTTVSSVPGSIGYASAASSHPPAAMSMSPSNGSITSSSTAQYGTPLSSPTPEVLTPRAMSVASLHHKMSLEQLAAAAVDTLINDLGTHQRS